jgi:outer membrane protein assembly factor BamB
MAAAASSALRGRLLPLLPLLPLLLADLLIPASGACGTNCNAGSFVIQEFTTCNVCGLGTWCDCVQGCDSTGCFPCPSGTFRNTTGGSSLESCEPCFPGTSGPNPSASSCFQCTPGQYQDLYNQTSCKQCEPGTALGIYGATGPCPQCPAGRYASAYGLTFCTACPPGTSLPVAGGSSLANCSACPSGTFSTLSSGGSPNCTDCSPGFYNPSPGQAYSSSCLPCGAGTASSISGANSSAACVDCPAGQYAMGSGNTRCVECPAGTRGNASAATSPSQCIDCEPGQFSTGGNATCGLCSPGSYAGASGSSACLPSVANSFVADPGAVAPTPCSDSTSTSGRTGATSPSACAPCPTPPCPGTLFHQWPTFGGSGARSGLSPFFRGPNGTTVVVLDVFQTPSQDALVGATVVVGPESADVYDSLVYSTRAGGLTAVRGGTNAGAMLFDLDLQGPVCTSSPSLDPLTGAAIFGCDDGVVRAVGPKSKAIAWASPLSPSSPIRSSPLVTSSGLAYIGNDDGTVFCIDTRTSTGTISPPLWSSRLPLGLPVRSSPALGAGSPDLIFVADLTAVYALSASNGSVAWIYDSSGDVAGAPALVSRPTAVAAPSPVSGSASASDPDPSLLLFAATDFNIYAVTASTGSLQWLYSLGAAVVGGIALGPSDAANSSDFTAQAIVGDVSGGLHAVSTSTGTRLWRVQLSGPVLAGATVGTDGIIYVGCGSGNTSVMYGIDSRAGAILWSVVLPASPTSSAALTAQGHLYFLGDGSSSLYRISSSGMAQPSPSPSPGSGGGGGGEAIGSGSGTTTAGETAGAAIGGVILGALLLAGIVRANSAMRRRRGKGSGARGAKGSASSRFSRVRGTPEDGPGSAGDDDADEDEVEDGPSSSSSSSTSYAPAPATARPAARYARAKLILPPEAADGGVVRTPNPTAAAAGGPSTATPLLGGAVAAAAAAAASSSSFSPASPALRFNNAFRGEVVRIPDWGGKSKSAAESAGGGGGRYGAMNNNE